MEMAYKIMPMVVCYKTTGSAKLHSEKQLWHLFLQDAGFQ